MLYKVKFWMFMWITLAICIGQFQGFSLEINLSNPFVYFSEITNQSLKIINRDTLLATSFGVRADYNKNKGTDNTKLLQHAIDYCSKYNKVLKLPKGKILLNSYGTSDGARGHGNILDIQTNMIIDGNHSEIIIGKAFHNKPFIVFSALNTFDPLKIKTLHNVIIKNLKINFNSEVSYMADGYMLRKGIELGNTIDGEIVNCRFFNGDLTCAIATGYKEKKISRNIKIYRNVFENLIKSANNSDHSSIYLNSENSVINNNTFVNTSIQGKLIACASELHNSGARFYNNVVSGYTRMLYVAAIKSENIKIKNIVIEKNKASITNAGIYLWLDESSSISDILIRHNLFECSHLAGYSMSSNGTQGILADATDEKNTQVINLSIFDNITNIKKTEINGRAVNFSTKHKFKNINNICRGCIDGTFYK